MHDPQGKPAGNMIGFLAPQLDDDWGERNTRIQRDNDDNGQIRQQLAMYLGRLKDAPVATQKETKDQLAKRLRASAECPQVVKVRARGDEPGGEYAIMPREIATQAWRIIAEQVVFTPITASLRKEMNNAKIPPIEATRRRLPTRGELRRKRSGQELPQKHTDLSQWATS